jgi:nitroreductase
MWNYRVLFLNPKGHLWRWSEKMQADPKIEQGPISIDTLYDILGAAMNMPSAAIGQSTQFVVLNEIDALSRASEVVPVPPFTMQALAAIIVCGDINKAQIKDEWMLDCEVASQQVLLATHANGLGAYISPIYPDRDRVDGMTVLLDLPENVIAHSYVAMGYPARVPDAREAFSNERVHYNSWVRKKSTF